MFEKRKKEDRKNLLKFYIIKGDITNPEKIKKHNIDAVINAARPTLMGGTENGVDRRIHEVIDQKLREKGDTECFNDKIRREIDGVHIKPEETIRCQRGRAVVTGGYGLCPYVIHVVGTKYPKGKSSGKKRMKISCPSSSVQGLESCYYEVVQILKQYSDIRSVAIPLVGSGNYGFPAEYSLRIALAGFYNAILEWYQRDPEIFSMENNRESSVKPYIKVYFYIYDTSAVSEDEYKKMLKMLYRFRKYIEKEKRISYRSSVTTQFQYFAEILKNDQKRGYFTIAKAFRLILVALRILFSPLLLVKDLAGRNDWKRRRCIVEVLSIVKAVSGILFWKLTFYVGGACLTKLLMVLSIVFLLDTVSYLLTLIILSDIQRPSTNIIRSLILLFVNYVEVQLDLAFVYYCFYDLKSQGFGFYDALVFAFFGTQTEMAEVYERSVQIFCYLREGLSFLFITFAFGYFLNHVRPRKFSS